MQLLSQANKQPNEVTDELASSPAGKPISLGDCAHEVLDSVTPVNRFIRRQMCTCQKDLSLPQFRTLVCVNQGPERSLSAVAYFLGSSMPTASRIVAGLVQKRLLVRHGCADRRQVSLELTEQGRNLMEKAWSGAQSAMEAKLQNLDASERLAVANAMGLLKTIFGSAGLMPRTCGMRSPAASNAEAANTLPGTVSKP